MATSQTIKELKRAGRLCRDAGYTVQFLAGWTSRGKGDMHIRGVVQHHDASSRSSGEDGALHVVVHGRPGLRNSLSAVATSRSGIIRVVAAGRSWHAGYGSWAGYSDLNTFFAGNEAANDGRGEPWSPQSVRAQLAWSVALCLVSGARPGRVPEHKDADPRRKIDRAGFAGSQWRHRVASWVSRGEVPPASGDDTPPEKDWFDMATKQDLREVVRAELDKDHGEIRGVVRSAVYDLMLEDSAAGRRFRGRLAREIWEYGLPPWPADQDVRTQAWRVLARRSNAVLGAINVVLEAHGVSYRIPRYGDPDQTQPAEPVE